MPWTIVSRPEDPFQILESLTHIYLTEKGVTQEQIKSGSVKPYLTARIDAHDNRPTTLVESACLPPEADKRKRAALQFMAYLETYKGKNFLFCDPTLVELFQQEEFSFSEIDPCKRVVETTPAGLRGKAESKAEVKASAYTIQTLQDPEKYFDRILELMTKSGFLASKIAEYKAKGVDGIRVMCEASRVQGLFNSQGKLVGLCRDVYLGKNDNGEKIGYLGDTLINPEDFMNGVEKQNPTAEENIRNARARGTQELYHQASRAFNHHYHRIVLIAPPTREKEFEDHFGFKKPQSSMSKPMKILYRFGQGTPKFQEKLDQHAAVIKARKTMHWGAVALSAAAIVGISLFQHFRPTAAGAEATKSLLPGMGKG